MHRRRVATATGSVSSPPRGGHERRTAAESFGDRLARHVHERRSQLVLGLDPDPMKLWPRALELERADEPATADPARRAAQAMAIHCALAIDAVADHCVAVKLQLACFERLGAAGRSALGEVADHVRRHGLLLILDAKRGDIDVSAAAYAASLFDGVITPFGAVPGLASDAVTVNPLLGADALAPFVVAARRSGAGVFVLVRTSNPGAADLQALRLEDGREVSERLAEIVDALGGEGRGTGGLSDVGAVVGATAPDHVERLRELMPSAVFLLPGVGAQGGRVETLAPAFRPGPAGGLVTVSRGLVNAYERDGGDPSAAAAREAERLRAITWELAESSAR